MKTESEQKKILIIDDDPEIHESLSLVFEGAGYKVFHSFDGEDGSYKIYSIKPDCVILDLLLPYKNGFEIIRESKGNSRTKGIPVVVLTSVYISEENKHKGFRLGSSIYLFKGDLLLMKPYPAEEVFEQVEILLGLKEKPEKVKERVVIVEDDRDTIFLLKRILEQEGFEVRFSETGQEGLNLIRAFKPHLVLLDYILPDTDGMEVLREIKKTQPLISCIVMTAYGSEELAVESLKRGADDYLPKPFPFTREVVLKIEENMEKSRLKRETERLLQTLKESNYKLLEKYEEAEKRLMEIKNREKSYDNRLKESTENLRKEMKNLQKNLYYFREEVSALFEESQKAFGEIRAKLQELRPEEEKFTERLRQASGKIRENIQKIEVLIYKIKERTANIL